MRLTVPGPRDMLSALERGGHSVEQVLAAVPRLLALLDDAEEMVPRANRLVEDIERTRAAAEDVATRTQAVVERVNVLVGGVTPLTDRLVVLLDSLEPSLLRLRPTLERLAETTSPAEVDAVVQLVDQLPALSKRVESDVLPILDSLASVSPDLHDLLDVSRELNELLGEIPGVSRVKKRIDRQQAEEARAGTDSGERRPGAAAGQPV